MAQTIAYVIIGMAFLAPFNRIHQKYKQQKDKKNRQQR